MNALWPGLVPAGFDVLAFAASGTPGQSTIWVHTLGSYSPGVALVLMANRTAFFRLTR